MFIINKFGKNFEEKLISASFKMFGTKQWKLKSVTNSGKFYPEPPNNEKLKSSVLDHSEHLCNFTKIFFSPKIP